MPFDEKRIRSELSRAPLVSPFHREQAIAIVCDVFRLANLAPPFLDFWNGLNDRFRLVDEQLGMLAHLFTATSMREQTVALLPRALDVDQALVRFFEAIAPLTAEMIRSNAFRQEELLRRWAQLLGAEIPGENMVDLLRKLEQLDFRKTLKEYDRAERAREVEGERRRKLLQEAQKRETEARGWRE